MVKQFRKIISLALITVFVGSSLSIPPAQAGEMVVPIMPQPGTMVNLSPAFTPALLKGITIHTDDALKFDFLIHKGEGNLNQGEKSLEYRKLVKYFLASLTIPDQNQWVNLSPHEKNRVIQDNFGKTEMGRDLLAQDYLLKQITSSLMYPESGLGKSFWDKVYERAYEEYGVTDVPLNTFNKVWIIPDEAAVYESGNEVYVLRNHLKAMLEEDYLSLSKNSVGAGSQPALEPAGPESGHTNSVNTLGSQIIREVLLPEIEKEINEGKNFASLRQIYSGMILATWYKRALKESLLGKAYADQSKVKGVDQDPKRNEVIYQKYLAAFKKGVFNYIKEDADKYTKEVIPRKYFAGGAVAFQKVVDVAMVAQFQDAALLVIRPGDGIPDFVRSRLNPEDIANEIDRVKVSLVEGDQGSNPVDAAMNAEESAFKVVNNPPISEEREDERIRLLIGELLGQYDDSIDRLKENPEALLEIFKKLERQLALLLNSEPVRRHQDWYEELTTIIAAVKKSIVAAEYNIAYRESRQRYDFYQHEAERLDGLLSEAMELTHQGIYSSPTVEQYKYNDVIEQAEAAIQRFTGLLNNLEGFELEETGQPVTEHDLLESFRRMKRVAQSVNQWYALKEELVEAGAAYDKSRPDITRTVVSIIIAEINKIIKSGIPDMSVESSRHVVPIERESITSDNAQFTLFTPDAAMTANQPDDLGISPDLLQTMKLDNQRMRVWREQYKAAYAEHIENSRRHILAGAEGLKGTALLLGLGNATEYSLEGLAALAKQFDKLIAVDADGATVKQILADLDAFLLQRGEKPLSRKFEVRVDDLSGILKDFSNRADQIVAESSSAPHALREIAVLLRDELENLKQLAPHPYKASYVVSSLVLSQLGYYIHRHGEDLLEKKFRAKNVLLRDEEYRKALVNLISELQVRHIRDLHGWVEQNGRVYFSDTTFEFFLARNREGTVVLNSQSPHMLLNSVVTALGRLFQYEPSETWVWYRVPPAAAPNSRGSAFQVEASLLSPRMKTDIASHEPGGKIDQAMVGQKAPGGIDFNSANLNLQIVKRDGRGVPLPLIQQDITQLDRIQGFSPVIMEIKAIALPMLGELQQQLRPPTIANAS